MANRKWKCSNYSRYKGIRKPKCVGGRGCQSCWDFYHIIRTSKEDRNPPPAESDSSAYYSWYCTMYGGP